NTNHIFTVPHDGNPLTDTATVTLHGSGYDWLLGNLSYQWMYDGNVVGTTESLTLQLEPGTKDFTLIVRDSSGNFATDTVHVTVLPESNSPPIASAGPDQTIACKGVAVPVLIHGNGSDPDGDPVTYKWSNGASTQDLNLVL